MVIAVILLFVAATATSPPLAWQAELRPDGSLGTVLLARRHVVSTTKEADSKIPANVLFNHKRNLLNASEEDIAGDEQEKLLQTNVRHTISSFRGAASAKVLFWDNEQCSEGLRSLPEEFGGEELQRDFAEEEVGMVKSDLCRLAMLYLYGGYYFDTDILPVVSMRDQLDKDVTFSTVVASGNEAFFQAFLAASPRHPLIAKAIHRFKDWYHELRQPGVDPGQMRSELANGNIGTSLLKQAYRSWSGQDVQLKVTHHNGHVSRFFLESAIMDLPISYSSALPGRSDGFCNYAVVDPSSQTLLMYSRVFDSHSHLKCIEEANLLLDLAT
mmetsp:Transcript_4090/g.9551  ORF Transcript_4090/g.9551 Transcript_4090/m.9551 type:complete len:328 (+) Transcript_4090:47-1030(+)